MNFLENLKDQFNYTITENGALTHRSTMNGVVDLFALGGAYRSRSDKDVIKLFETALLEDESFAMKCLFYLRDIRGGQGERRFFRVCINWLAKNHPEVARRNLQYIPEFGRWDDLYALFDTPLHCHVIDLMKAQFVLDLKSQTPSLLGKWLKSENASSLETKRLACETIKGFDISPREYRIGLSTLRKKINILERLMSENRWDEIKFDKIPSRAGFIYKNTFARKDIIKEKYLQFIEDSKTKIHAGTLYPYECVKEAWRVTAHFEKDGPEYLAVNKYWDNLTDYFNGMSFNGISVVDTSSSMTIGYGTNVAPIYVALSIGLYCAEKSKGPFKNHFITFSDSPELIEVKGNNFCEKVNNMDDADWKRSTDIYRVFNLLLNVAVSNHCNQSEIPENIIIVSDMEFNRCTNIKETTFMAIKKEWDSVGYKLPHLIFWNVSARQNNIPMLSKESLVSFVSGFSPVIFESLLRGLSGEELIYEKLRSERYSKIF